MKKILAFALTLCMLVALFATVASADSGTVTIKAAHHTAVDSTFNYGFELFKDKIEELSDGKMVVEIYPAGQLGDQTELIQQLQSDTIQMMISSCADVANFAPVVGVLDVPYMLETKQQAWNAMDGEAGEFFNNTIKEKLGVYCCGWWSGGTRSVFSSVAPIVTVDDMANLKIRTQPADVHVNSFTALGATVTPIAYTELYSALQQKVVDAAENDPSNYYSMKFYEVCKYYSLTEHIQQVAGSPVMVSTKFYDGLTDEQRAWFDEAAEYAEAEQRQYVEDSAAEYIALLEKEGVTVNEVDKASFIEKLQPFYESYVYPTYGEDVVNMLRSAPTE